MFLAVKPSIDIKVGCTLCMLSLDEKLNVEHLEKIKKQLLGLTTLAEEVYGELKTIAEFDASITELWDKDFFTREEIIAKGRNGKCY